MNLRIYIVGHKGYLGSHLLRHFAERGYTVHSLDLRKGISKDFRLEEKDVVIDCSRIKEFDEITLKEDYVATIKLLDLTSECGAIYTRIGSVLELDSLTNQVPYVAWSKERSRLILESETNHNAKLVLVPNIYGGDASSSILDRLRSANADGENFTLYEPTSMRDFLSIGNFLTGVEEILGQYDSDSPITTVMTSGYLYEIESIWSCIKFQNPHFLKRQPASYAVLGEVRKIADTLLILS